MTQDQKREKQPVVKYQVPDGSWHDVPGEVASYIAVLETRGDKLARLYYTLRNHRLILDETKYDRGLQLMTPEKIIEVIDRIWAKREAEMAAQLAMYNGQAEHN